MTDQDDFRPPRKPPWPLQQTQHHLMQSDLETARQRIQQPPRTTKPTTQATTAKKTSMTPKRPKQEQRAPYTYPGIHIKQHLLSRAISAYNRTKDQGTEPEHKTNNQIRPSPRRNTTPKQNQNEEIRSKVQLHKDIQNQAIRATTQTTKPATRKNQTIKTRTKTSRNPATTTRKQKQHEIQNVNTKPNIHKQRNKVHNNPRSTSPKQQQQWQSKAKQKQYQNEDKQTKDKQHSITRLSKPAWGFVLGRRRGGFPMLDWRRNYLNTLVAYRRCVNPGSILIGLRIGRMRQGWYKLALYYY